MVNEKKTGASETAERLGDTNADVYSSKQQLDKDVRGPGKNRQPSKKEQKKAAEEKKKADEKRNAEWNKQLTEERSHRTPTHAERKANARDRGVIYVKDGVKPKKEHQGLAIGRGSASTNDSVNGVQKDIVFSDTKDQENNFVSETPIEGVDAHEVKTKDYADKVAAEHVKRQTNAASKNKLPGYPQKVLNDRLFTIEPDYIQTQYGTYRDMYEKANKLLSKYAGDAKKGRKVQTLKAICESTKKAAEALNKYQRALKAFEVEVNRTGASIDKDVLRSRLQDLAELKKATTIDKTLQSKFTNGVMSAYNTEFPPEATPIGEETPEETPITESPEETPITEAPEKVPLKDEPTYVDVHDPAPKEGEGEGLARVSVPPISSDKDEAFNKEYESIVDKAMAYKPMSEFEIDSLTADQMEERWKNNEKEYDKVHDLLFTDFVQNVPDGSPIVKYIMDRLHAIYHEKELLEKRGAQLYNSNKEEKPEPEITSEKKPSGAYEVSVPVKPISLDDYVKDEAKPAETPVKEESDSAEPETNDTGESNELQDLRERSVEDLSESELRERYKLETSDLEQLRDEYLKYCKEKGYDPYEEYEGDDTWQSYYDHLETLIDKRSKTQWFLNKAKNKQSNKKTTKSGGNMEQPEAELMEEGGIPAFKAIYEKKISQEDSKRGYTPSFASMKSIKPYMVGSKPVSFGEGKQWNEIHPTNIKSSSEGTFRQIHKSANTLDTSMKDMRAL